MTFLRAAADRSLVIGFARDRHDEVVDPCVDHLHQPLPVHFGRPDYGVISYYGGDAAGLRLGDEFHVNRQQLVSARVESLPLRDAPAWTLERLVEVALGWLTSGRLRTEDIVTPVVPFGESVEAYREIDEHPERSIKLGIRFP
jgi:hypothetical protein